MNPTGWRERVALAIYDEMAAAGTDLHAAGLVGQAVLAELRKDPSLPELFLVRHVDTFGERHDVIQRQLPAGGVPPLRHFDILKRGKAERQAIAREFDVHLRAGAGSEI